METKVKLSATEKFALARHPERPKITDYVNILFQDFFEQRGDRHGKDDKSIFGGIGLFDGQPVTVIGHRKGKDLNENIECNFGMPGPEGYRKAMRMMDQAEKFGRPVITFIDTPGAYPGLEAEMYGQSQAIAESMAKLSGLTVPVIAIITGEGSSGGALALGVANKVYMLEHAVYSILSPEGFSSILWKDASRHAEAAEIMRCTSENLLDLGVIDGIIREPRAGAHKKPEMVYARIERMLRRELGNMKKLSGQDLMKKRMAKFRNMDSQFLKLK